MRSISPEALDSFVRQVCTALGSHDFEAELVACQLVRANLTGHDSHGVGMLPAYVAGALAGKLRINGHVRTVVDTGPLLVFDGDAGFGQVMGFETMNETISRAKTHGVAIVGLRNSFHIGRIGHWAEQCARAGLASIHFVNVVGHSPLVAPFGGGDARFGTNPFCVAIPSTGDRPAVLLDMATSKIAMGKARVAFNKGEAVPADTLLDGHGQMTTDPTGMFSNPRSGALVAMGDHKGSGLAIVCELLGAALLGGPVMGEASSAFGGIINNMLTIAIDPSAITSRNALADEASNFLDYVKDSPPRDGFSEILVPGEPEARSEHERAVGIQIDDTTIEELRSCARSAGAPNALDLLS